MILCRERSPLSQRDAHHSEITIADTVPGMTFGVLRCGHSFDRNVFIGNVLFATAVDCASDRRSANTGQPLDLLYRLLEECPAARLIQVRRFWERHGHCEQARSVEPGLDGIKEQEAPNHQPRASQ